MRDRIDRTWLSSSVTFALLVAALVGCSSDDASATDSDHEPSTAAGGSASQGGGAGHAGAGKGGDAGQGGQGGQAAQGGSSGKGGQPGAAGQGGSAGKAGGSAGKGGSGAAGSGQAGAGQAGSGAGGFANGGAYAACGGNIVDAKTGAIDWAEYEKQAKAWDGATIDCRLGPRWADVHAGEQDKRTTLAEAPASRQCGGDGTMPSYEYGPDGCKHDCPSGYDFGSTTGQALYWPDDAAGPGIDRVSTFAYDGALVQVRPNRTTGPYSYHPDAALASPLWPSLGFSDPHPVAMVRSRYWWSNQALVLFKGGFLGAAGTRTDGVDLNDKNGLAKMSLGFKFPDAKVPTAIAVSTLNELAFVTVWDVEAHKGQLAVLSLRANFPLAHTWWYPALPNAGGFTNVKLLGYVDLPFATPTSVSAATDGFYNGSPNDGAQKLLSQYDLMGTKNGQAYCNDDVRKAFLPEGALGHVAATRGYAVVASRWENKVAFVDLAPLTGYLKKMYFGSYESCLEVAKGFAPAGDVAPGEGAWPYTFEQAPEALPTLSAVLDVPSPRAVLAGQLRGYNPDGKSDYPKAYALSDAGALHVLSPNGLIGINAQHPPVKEGPPSAVTALPVCAHPTSMQLHRWSVNATNVDPSAPSIDLSGMNAGVIVVCRGEREIDVVNTYQDKAKLVWSLSEKHMTDPVAVDVNDRGPIWTLADFDGKKIVNYQLGPAGNGCSTNHYAPNPADDKAIGVGGEYALPGSVFDVSTTNVN